MQLAARHKLSMPELRSHAVQTHRNNRAIRMTRHLGLYIVRMKLETISVQLRYVLACVENIAMQEQAIAQLQLMIMPCKARISRFNFASTSELRRAVMISSQVDDLSLPLP